MPGNDLMAVFLGQGAALVWLIFRLDKRLAVIETEIKYIKLHIRLDTKRGAD